MVNIKNYDYRETATIVSNPSNLTGDWTTIEAMTNLTSVSIVDSNLSDTSLAWADTEFLQGVFRYGNFKKVTFTGRAILYK
ncbi:MAG: hypothetical protein GY804_03640 [Alphaproteobacteria bacterium]|nr:hypothetical protein [Alphaproteobacteria bacterium]